MADSLTVSQRSYCMSQIGGKNTKPEKIVRSIVYKLGFRYRLHYKKLSGKPDLVFPSRKKVIFVHGCYWHRHNCKKGKSIPITNKMFWKNKLDRNKERDKENKQTLRKLGWKILTIWECQIKNPAKLTEQINKFLN